MPRWTGGVITLDAGTIANDAISSSAAIDADKMQHTYKPGTNLAVAAGSAPATRREMLYVASQAGTIRAACAMCKDTGTSASITVDFLKNGTTILSSTISITNATTDAQVQTGTLSTTTFAADDYFEINVTVSSSTGMTGFYAWLELEENTAP